MAKVVNFVDELPTENDPWNTKEIADILKSRPGTWAEIDLEGFPGWIFINSVRRNQFSVLPTSNFDVQLVNNKIYMRYTSD